MKNEILEGITLFNNFDFFAAHDFFEKLWNYAEKEDRLFYQGLVQISVGSYHLINKNFNGALSQYKKGTDKLQNYVPHYKNLELAELLKKIGSLIKDLETFSFNDSINIDLDKIPKLEKIS